MSRSKPMLTGYTCLALVLLLAGCLFVNDSSNKAAQPAFVPPCDEAAPSRLEYYTRAWDDGGAKATANLMVDRGWVNVVKEKSWIGGDCVAGTAEPVSVQWRVQEAAKEQERVEKSFAETWHVIGGFIVLMFGLMFGSSVTGAYNDPSYIGIGLFIQVLEVLAWQLAGVSGWWPVATGVILVLVIFLRLRHPSESKELP